MSDVRITAAVGKFLPSPLRALALIVAAFAIANAIVVALVSRSLPRSGPAEFVMALIFGGAAAQPLLFGLWAALGPGPVTVRLPLVLASMYVVLLAGCLPLVFQEDKHENAAGFLCIAGGIGSIIFIATAAAGAFVRWCTARSVQHRLTVPSQAFHFNIRYLLGLTTLVAVLLGISGPLLRGLSSLPDTGPGPTLVARLFLMAGAIGVTVLPTAFIPWIALSTVSSRASQAAAILFWLVWTSVWGLIVAWLSSMIEPVGFLIAVQAACAIVVALSTVVLYRADYRIVMSSADARAVLLATTATENVPVQFE